MSTQKAKFELFARLQKLGFTYEEAAQLRRIEMTLHRWAELECGDEYNRCIERDEETGKPFMTFESGSNGKRSRYAIADREAGALKRSKVIVDARNHRFGCDYDRRKIGSADLLIVYHQGDCRGCALYLVRWGDIPTLTREEWLKNSPTDTSETAFRAARERQIDSYYTRGLAVCA